MLIRQRCSALIVHSKALSDDELRRLYATYPGDGADQPHPCRGMPIAASDSTTSAAR
ncbi:hypothetical protein LNP74_17850 [Klebsiella pneumoniae subsp. pneumoniae]|nr:hypothetical protein [Klebsiella pneumoniae subsp. pneumoniae]